jgi:hypothetical protein
MILESLKSAPAKVIHVFDLTHCDGKTPKYDFDYNELKYKKINEFKNGRSLDVDMKIADISVSRVHSYIRFVGN